jgi:hypothetical protein
VGFEEAHDFSADVDSGFGEGVEHGGLELLDGFGVCGGGEQPAYELQHVAHLGAGGDSDAGVFVMAQVVEELFGFLEVGFDSSPDVEYGW